MSIFEQRQEQRLRLLLVSPAVIIAAIAALAILTARDPGNPPREAVFDLITRLAPRPADELPVATILIDDESTDRLGSWPWPRSVFGQLIDAAENAGAASVVLSVSVTGNDPLSPDVVARRWLTAPDNNSVERLNAIALLPSNDLLLARAAAGGPVGLGVAPELFPTKEAVRWQEAQLSAAPWLKVEGDLDRGASFSLPAVPGAQRLSAELREARLAAAAGFPKDPDERVRRFAPLYALGDEPVAAAGLAGLAAAGEDVTIALGSSLLSSIGNVPVRLEVGAGEPIGLNRRGEMRLWLPKDVTVETIPAWRVLRDPDAWTASLEGKHVFIGEVQSAEGRVRTGRGTLPAASLHALIAGQIKAGVTLTRPFWAGFAEAAGAILLGALAVAAVLFLPPVLATALVLILTSLSFLAAFFIFRASGMLIDPTPGMFAAVGGPMAVGATVLTNMVVRDDRVRGAFHGALPQKAMRKLQSHGGSKLLHGVYREVTVLSCALKLPPSLVKRFQDEPRDFVLFQASANDRLRRTILKHHGTVDHGEDGRLLGYWNVPIDEPKHVELACACALDMLDDVSTMSQQVAGSHHVAPGGDLEELADARIEIGIATGRCFAGPVGLGGRNRYAALGQPVALAGRLRARSELYGPAILTDARVFDALRHHYAFLDLDYVRRDEETPPEVIYGLVGSPFIKASKTFRDLAEVQRELLDAWRAKDLAEATKQLQKLRGVPGVPQPYVELFERRIREARLAKGRRETDHAELLGY